VISVDKSSTNDEKFIKRNNENPFLNKYFKVTESFDENFEHPEKSLATFHFEDNSTVIYYQYFYSGWEHSKGQYSFSNNEIVLYVPGFFTGNNTDVNFGGEVKVINETEIDIYVGHNPRYKLYSYVPKKN
jgi:hypothetical protein